VKVFLLFSIFFLAATHPLPVRIGIRKEQVFCRNRSQPGKSGCAATLNNTRGAAAF
jgi:hypothetical protein